MAYQNTTKTTRFVLYPFQVIILLVGAFIAPTNRVVLVLDRYVMYSELYCSFGYGFLAACAYNAILILLCCYYAFRTRSVPDNYNESKFIGVSVYSNVVVCLSVVPVHSVAKAALHKVAIVCVALIVNAYLHTLCVYVPKIYAVRVISDDNDQSRSLSTKNKTANNNSRPKSASTNMTNDISQSAI